MAKLGAYYSLCPLIDHRSLLGICEDTEPGNVIVTLGKNIAIKYKVRCLTNCIRIDILMLMNSYSFMIKNKFLVGEQRINLVRQ